MVCVRKTLQESSSCDIHCCQGNLERRQEQAPYSVDEGTTRGAHVATLGIRVLTERTAAVLGWGSEAAAVSWAVTVGERGKDEASDEVLRRKPRLAEDDEDAISRCKLVVVKHLKKNYNFFSKTHFYSSCYPFIKKLPQAPCLRIFKKVTTQ